MNRLRPVLAILLTLLLLGAQQAALAHLAGHAAAAGTIQPAGDGDGDHGAGLTQLCTTCLAFAALDGAAAAAVHLLHLAQGCTELPGAHEALPPPDDPRRAHRARAPPAVS